MKKLLALTLLAAGACAHAQIQIAPIAGSISINKPGVYGRIDIGQQPPPPVQLVYPQPVVIAPTPVAVVQQPIYLRVPPGHSKNWGRYCGRYNACGQRVYFVQDGWYNGVYVPYYRHAHRGYAAPVAVVEPAPVYAYAPPPPQPRYYQVPVTSVRAVMGAPEQRCWVERQQVVDSSPNVPGAIVGAVIGGVLGHQVGGGRGQTAATIGGAVAGAAIGGNVGRDNEYGQDVQHCTDSTRYDRPDYWDVTYVFDGLEHRVQMSNPPGATITVNRAGEPRV